MTHLRPLLAAPVQGFAAFVLDKTLAKVLPAQLESLEQSACAGRLHPDRVGEVRMAWAAIQAASEEWATRRAAADGSAAASATAVDRSSEEIDTSAAATLLQVSPNRVRQLIRDGLLPARKVSRVWVVSRHDVEFYAGGMR